MALYERIVGRLDSGDPLPDGMVKIPAHQFQSALNEWGRGFATRAQVIAAFGVSPAEEAALDYLAGKWAGRPTAEQYELRQTLHDIFLLGEAGLKYSQEADAVARINAQFP